eukprot:11527404-Heterocapsa_arctica.AAC.1
MAARALKYHIAASPYTYPGPGCVPFPPQRRARLLPASRAALAGVRKPAIRVSGRRDVSLTYSQSPY